MLFSSYRFVFSCLLCLLFFTTLLLESGRLFSFGDPSELDCQKEQISFDTVNMARFKVNNPFVFFVLLNYAI